MGKPVDYDFEGWATKNNLRCIDGRVIRKGAFKVNDGQTVPLVWNHNHTTPSSVLGRAMLHNMEDGVYAYCTFNNSPAGRDAKECVEHGDVKSLSICANNIEQDGPNVTHGIIREVSLVLAGANPGAFIESVLAHGEPLDDDDTEGIVYNDSEIILHAATGSNENPEDVGKDSKNDETIGDIFETLTEKQKQAVAVIVGQAIEDSKSESENNKKNEGDEKMSHNIFDKDTGEDVVLYHDAFNEVLDAAKRQKGSLREFLHQATEDGFLEHSVDTTGMEVATGKQVYGFNDPSMLFPEFKNLNTTPEWLSRNMDWVSKVMSAVHRTPFARIRSTYANITEDDARARGYIKGKQKKEEVFTTLKRTTGPQTIYKLQKLDRDDIDDIVDFDVVAWIRAEMRVMLNEEIARAILIGDGRPSDSEYKIQEIHIRPIINDVPLFNTKVAVTVTASDDEQAKAKKTVNAIIRARKNYKGSGSPTLFTSEDALTDMLLLEDGVGRKLYKTEAELATSLRVKEIVPIELLEGQKVKVGEAEKPLIGIIVNLADYNVGADKGGEIENMEDFDIDFNQYKYLIETRISGALIKPYSALTIYEDKITASGQPSSGGSGVGTP